MQITKQNISIKTNLWLMILLTIANLFVMFYVPLYLLPKSLMWAFLLIPVLLCSNTYWYLMHESIHYVFNPQKKVNNICGRIIGIIYGTVYQISQFRHLMHHGYSRTDLERVEVYEPTKHSYAVKMIMYYTRLLVGVYFLEFLLPIVAFFPSALQNKIVDTAYADHPNIDKIVKNRLLNSQSLTIIRFDAIVMYALVALTFICYGKYGWLWLIAIFARAFLLSVTDNLPHYGTPVNQVRYAYNLSMPNFLSKFILNFNFHRIHHEYPNVPWSGLIPLKNQLSEGCEGNYFKQGIRQFKGLIDIKRLSP